MPLHRRCPLVIEDEDHWQHRQSVLPSSSRSPSFPSTGVHICSAQQHSPKFRSPKLAMARFMRNDQAKWFNKEERVFPLPTLAMANIESVAKEKNESEIISKIRRLFLLQNVASGAAPNDEPGQADVWMIEHCLKVIKDSARPHLSAACEFFTRDIRDFTCQTISLKHFTIIATVISCHEVVKYWLASIDLLPETKESVISAVSIIDPILKNACAPFIDSNGSILPDTEEEICDIRFPRHDHIESLIRSAHVTIVGSTSLLDHRRNSPVLPRLDRTTSSQCPSENSDLSDASTGRKEFRSKDARKESWTDAPSKFQQGKGKQTYVEDDEDNWTDRRSEYSWFDGKRKVLHEILDQTESEGFLRVDLGLPDPRNE